MWEAAVENLDCLEIGRARKAAFVEMQGLRVKTCQVELDEGVDTVVAAAAAVADYPWVECAAVAAAAVAAAAVVDSSRTWARGSQTLDALLRETFPQGVAPVAVDMGDIP